MPKIKKAHPTEDAQDEAVVAMTALAGQVAIFYGVCPTCLVYALADSIAEAEDKGLVGHGPMQDDHPELTEDEALAHFLRNVRPVGGEQ